jgi:radical SAM superfamily enzyme YgiQ (UPF0313 family)
LCYDVGEPIHPLGSPMPDIVLATLNARYHHAAFGLRYLLANLCELRERAVLREFTINHNTTDVLDAILQEEPRIVGIGVYIWNVEPATRLVADLKRIRPDLVVVLGGPEVSYETDEQPIAALADYVIRGEGDVAFRELCAGLLDDPSQCPGGKLIDAPLPRFEDLELPYDLYTDEDLRNRVIYVEASRGCPFTCEFCLSALEVPVRQVPLGPFLDAMQSLLDRGANRFKFVDRTFNLNLRVGTEILRFFLDRYFSGLFLHFEMIPDRFPAALKELVRQFPPGALQFEVGIQTFNEEVAELISRRQDNARVAEILRFLREETGVHVHADLIVGLPGESLDSFAAGFDRLVALRPHEIQVGMLKRLRGTPIVRHDAEWGMVYSPNPPYEILQTRLIDYSAMSAMRRFARYWDLVVNSGNFVESTPLIWGNGSPFAAFSRFAAWLHEAERRTHGIPLVRLAERVFEFLTRINGTDEELAARTIWSDYTRGGRHDRPRFLRRFELPTLGVQSTEFAVPARQARHLRVSK